MTHPICTSWTALFSQPKLNYIFPMERTDSFFDALFGGTEEGAYDIVLIFVDAEEGLLRFGFELRQRLGRCLACNLTSGLPSVFERHPILNLKQVATELASLAGWPQNSWKWEIGPTRQISRELHFIPFTVSKT